MEVIEKFNKIIVKNVEKFDLETTFNCGQAFRWKKVKYGHIGVVDKKQILVYFDQNGNFIIENSNISDFNSIWKKYFDLERNYSEINFEILNSPAAEHSSILKEAISNCQPIRILRQNPWEVLCSFIISQNNNIPRIIKIIEKFCENFGEKIQTTLPEFNKTYYSFPTCEVVSQLGLKDLDIIKSGFRAKYILDAAKKIFSGEVNLLSMEKQCNEEIKYNLMKINGVGPKIAECTLLFGFGRLDTFPVDTWIKKIMKKYFSSETPEIFGKYAGVAQQYLYHYARTILKP